MNKFLATTAALLALSTPTFAADIPMGGEPVAPAYIAPAAFSWNGAYVGLNAGYGFNGDFGQGMDDGSGYTVGVQAGYNVQFDPMVVGIEAELAYSGIEASAAPYSAELNWRGAITPRIGFAMDRFLPYIKAGVAFGSIDASDGSGNDSATLWGWTAGAGVEYAVTDQVSVKLEYAYTDLGDDTFSLGPDRSIGYAGSEIKLGVNYRF